jgi:hypothetical protein
MDQRGKRMTIPFAVRMGRRRPGLFRDGLLASDRAKLTGNFNASAPARSTEVQREFDRWAGMVMAKIRTETS